MARENENINLDQPYNEITDKMQREKFFLQLITLDNDEKRVDVLLKQKAAGESNVSSIKEAVNNFYAETYDTGGWSESFLKLNNILNNQDIFNSLELYQSYNKITDNTQRDKFILQLINLDDNEKRADILLKQKVAGESNINLIKDAVNNFYAEAYDIGGLSESLIKLSKILNNPALFNSLEVHLLEYRNLNKETSDEHIQIKRRTDFLSGLQYLELHEKLELLNSQYQKNPQNILDILSDIIKNPGSLPSLNRDETLVQLKIIQQTPELLKTNYAEINSSQEKTIENLLRKTLGLSEKEFEFFIKKKFEERPENAGINNSTLKMTKEFRSQINSELLTIVKSQFLSSILNLNEKSFNIFLEQYKSNPINLKNIIRDLNNKSDYSPALKEIQKLYVSIANNFLNQQSDKINSLLSQRYSEIDLSEDRKLFAEALLNLPAEERNKIFRQQQNEDFHVFRLEKYYPHNRAGEELCLEFGKVVKDQQEERDYIENFPPDRDIDNIDNSVEVFNIQSNQETPSHMHEKMEYEGISDDSKDNKETIPYTQEKDEALFILKELTDKAESLPPLPKIPELRDNKNSPESSDKMQQALEQPGFRDKFQRLAMLISKIENKPELLIHKVLNRIFFNTKTGGLKELKKCFKSDIGQAISSGRVGGMDIAGMDDQKNTAFNELYKKVSDIISTRLNESKNIRSGKKQNFYETQAQMLKVAPSRPGK